MAKTTGGLLSLGASGTIAKTLTFSKWKGQNYVRQRVIPANPRSTAQTEVRGAFAFASNIWKNMGSLGIAPWNSFALGQVLTGRNAFIGQFTRDNQGQADLSNLVMSPGSKGGIALTSLALAAGANQITATCTPPTPPTGWTLTSVTAIAILDQDPSAPTEFTTVADEDLAAPYEIVLTGLTTAVLYQVAAWPVWAKPDGTVAYGASLLDSETPT
jgi:hypothetical protein